jgi:hypothetical protein
VKTQRDDEATHPDSETRNPSNYSLYDLSHSNWSFHKAIVLEIQCGYKR